MVVLKLFAGKDEPLLILRDSFLVLDFGFYAINGVKILHLKGDSVSGQSLHDNLHPTMEMEYQP